MGKNEKHCKPEFLQDEENEIQEEKVQMSLTPKSRLGCSRPGHCDEVEGSPRYGRRPATAEVEVTGQAESDELKGSGKEWVGFID